MPTFQPCDESVRAMAENILNEFESHAPVREYEVKIDFVFAYATTDEHGIPKGCAIKKNGIRALGLTRVISLKDRAMGRGDVEICLDGDWWKDAPHTQQRALLDHELTHIMPLSVERDDLGRPKIRMRKHDVEIGFFHSIAARHGDNSMERIQAKQIMDEVGQLYWPDIAPRSSLDLAAIISGSDEQIAIGDRE